MVKLIVIRSADLPAMAGFYSLLGFEPDYHSHGHSPMHYSFATGGTVVEIYPLAKNQVEPDKFLRLGFEIENFDKRIVTLKQNWILFHAGPLQTEFGYMSVLSDP